MGTVFSEGENNDSATAVEFVPVAALSVPFGQPWLANEGDVDKYLAELKVAMMQAINGEKRIQV